MALMLAGSWWKLAHALDLASLGPGAKLSWAKQYLGVVAVPVAWLALALCYADVGEASARRRALVLLAFLPLAMLALVWTNSSHGLVWASAAVDRSGPFAGLAVGHGPWYWVHAAYSYALALAGTVVLVAGVAPSSRPYYPRGLALLTWVAIAPYLWGVEPMPNLNPSVLVLPITGASFALGLFRFGLLDLSPVKPRQQPHSVWAKPGLAETGSQSAAAPSLGGATRLAGTEESPPSYC